MDKGKSAMPLLAIVAIVAVVAVVMVVLQGRTPSSEEAVAGEATRTSFEKAVATTLSKAIMVGREAGAEPDMDCKEICGLSGRIYVDAYERTGPESIYPVVCDRPADAPTPIPTRAKSCRCA